MGPGTSKEARLDKIEGMKCIWSNFFLLPFLSNLRFIFSSDFPIVSLYSFMERSGSVVECLTRDREAAGLSLTGVTALWSVSKTHLF